MVAKYRSQFLVCPRFKLLWSCSFNEVLPARPESPLICEATWTFLTSSLQKDFHYISEKREQKLLLQGENSKRAQQNMSFDVASLGKYTSLHTEPRCIPPQYTISRLAKKQKKTPSDLQFTAMFRKHIQMASFCIKVFWCCKLECLRGALRKCKQL